MNRYWALMSDSGDSYVMKNMYSQFQNCTVRIQSAKHVRKYVLSWKARPLAFLGTAQVAFLGVKSNRIFSTIASL